MTHDNLCSGTSAPNSLMGRAAAQQRYAVLASAGSEVHDVAQNLQQQHETSVTWKQEAVMLTVVCREPVVI